MPLSQLCYEHEKDISQLRIKLNRFESSNLRKGGIDWPRFLIGTLVGQGIENIGQCGNASRKGDRRSQNVAWVP